MANFADSFLRGQALGMEQRRMEQDDQRKSKLGQLFSQAYGDPSQRQALVGQMGAIDPTFAMQADGAFAQQGDRKQQELSNRAKLLLSMPEQMRPQAWQRMAGDVAQMLGEPSLATMPYDATFEPVLRHFAGGEQQRPMNVGPGSAVIDPQTGKVIYERPFAPKTPVWDSARGGWVMPPDMSGGDSMPAQSAPQGPQQAPPMLGGGDIPDFATDATQVASAFGFTPTSIGRTPQENARLPGASPTSRHLDGQAIDLSIRGKSPQEIEAVSAAMRARGYVGGIHTKGTAPHLHFERPRGAAAPSGGGQSGMLPVGPGFIPVVPPKDGSEEAFSQPQEVKGPDGQPQLVQFGNHGTIRPVQGYGAPENAASANKEDMQNQRMVAQLSKRAADEQIPLVETQLRTIEGALQQFTDAKGDVVKDVPGFGRMDSLVPNWAASTEALDLRQQVQSLANVVLKSRSGAAVTDNELRRFLVEAGSGKMMPEAQLVKGIRLMRQWFNAQKSNLRAGYAPGIVQSYYDNAPENAGIFDVAPQGGATGEWGIEEVQ